MRKLLLPALPAVIASLALAPGAQGANVIVGSPLTGPFMQHPFGSLITAFNSKLPAGAVVSPVTGVVVGWHLEGGSGGPFYLRVISPTGPEWTAVGKSVPETPTTTGLERFATDLPIEAGDTVAIEPTSTTDTIDGAIGNGGEFTYFFPTLEVGATAPPALTEGAELAFNAEVLPPPTITSLGTTSGPTAGGTFVTIEGSGFTEVKGVTFGSAAAPFTVVSENQITAVSPPASAGAVSVTVTTDAGTATAAQGFIYTAAPNPGPTSNPTPIGAPARACKVPSLAGKRLKPAKKELDKADCKIGAVSKKKGVKTTTGKVVGQSPKAGSSKVAGTKVNVRLG